MNRIEGLDKVTGQARYAYEYPADSVAYAYPVQSSVARGQIASLDAINAMVMPGVLTVLSCADPPVLGRDASPELALFQTRERCLPRPDRGRDRSRHAGGSPGRREGSAHQLPA